MATMATDYNRLFRYLHLFFVVLAPHVAIIGLMTGQHRVVAFALGTLILLAVPAWLRTANILYKLIKVYVYSLLGMTLVGFVCGFIVGAFRLIAAAIADDSTAISAAYGILGTTIGGALVAFMVLMWIADVFQLFRSDIPPREPSKEATTEDVQEAALDRVA